MRSIHPDRAKAQAFATDPANTQVFVRLTPDVFKTKRGSASTSFSICCASLTWWSLRGGCTRSLSEHGRETPLRQWYFVSRRGRVGRCQVFQRQCPKRKSRGFVAMRETIFSITNTKRPLAETRAARKAAFPRCRGKCRTGNARKRTRSCQVPPSQETTPSELLRQQA